MQIFLMKFTTEFQTQKFLLNKKIKIKLAKLLGIILICLSIPTIPRLQSPRNQHILLIPKHIIILLNRVISRNPGSLFNLSQGPFMILQVTNTPRQICKKIYHTPSNGSLPWQMTLKNIPLLNFLCNSFHTLYCLCWIPQFEPNLPNILITWYMNRGYKFKYHMCCLQNLPGATISNWFQSSWGNIDLIPFTSKINDCCYLSIKSFAFDAFFVLDF